MTELKVKLKDLNNKISNFDILDCKYEWVVFLFSWLFAILFTFHHGINFEYDVQNYHLYNPWAFLNGRIGFDVMPADVNSYFNPYLDLITYFGFRFCNNIPFIFMGLYSVVFGFYALVVFKIAKMFFDRFYNIMASVIIAMTSSIVVFTISSFYNDLIIALLVLSSLYFVLKWYQDKKEFSSLLISASILGVTIALKMSVFFYALSIPLTIFVMNKKDKVLIKNIVLWFCVLGISFLLVDSYWLWKIYSVFKNPLFPYFNNIFKSPYANYDLILNSDFVHLFPKSFLEFIMYPFSMNVLKRNIGWEFVYQDFRLAGIYLSVIGTFGILLYNKFKNNQFTSPDKFNLYLFLLFFSLCSYLIWIKVFCQIRYVISLYALSGVIIIYFLKLLFDDILRLRYSAIYSVFLIMFILFTTHIPVDSVLYLPLYGNFRPFIEVSDANIPNGATVFIKSGCSYAALFQNPNVRYIYLNSDRFYKNGVNVISDTYINQIKNEINIDSAYVLYGNRYNSKEKYIFLGKALNNWISLKEYRVAPCKIISTSGYDTFFAICKISKRKH